MQVLNYDNLYKVFDHFEDNNDCYPGAMFISIYHECPICYSFSFSIQDKLQLNKYIERPSIKNIKHTIDDKVLLNCFMNDDKYEIIQYSTHDYLILGKKFPFLTIVEISDTSEKSVSLYQNVYLSNKIDDMSLGVLYHDLLPYFNAIKKEEDIDFGIAAVDGGGNLYTNYYDFKEVDVDIQKNYNDDIPYDKMVEILNRDESAELMLFYGEPGTGKSTLIKKFISDMPDKEFVFMDGTLLANVQQDRLMSYFMECQDTIFIFEDCEKILLNRDRNYNPTMSILLNLTDGIISDVLNIKIICTFNTELNNIDKALLRKGRLTLKYEFKKLDKEKAKVLLEDDTINKDMSLADIYYYKEENDYSKKVTGTIGFR